MSVVKNVRVHISKDLDEAIAQARAVFEHGDRNFRRLDEFIAKEAVGTPPIACATLK